MNHQARVAISEILAPTRASSPSTGKHSPPMTMCEIFASITNQVPNFHHFLPGPVVGWHNAPLDNRCSLIISTWAGFVTSFYFQHFNRTSVG